jgi:uncharacterized membrane protein
MSRTVKWILGIVLGLVALCALAVIGFFAFSRLNIGALVVRRRAVLPFEGQPTIPMAPFQGMPYRHFGGFSPFGFFGGWLVIAALLGLFALAVIALIVVLRRPSRAAFQPAATNQPAAPLQGVAPMQTAVTGQPPSSDEMSPGAPPEHSCPSCGRLVQADWSHCPYCGTALTGSA